MLARALAVLTLLDRLLRVTAMIDEPVNSRVNLLVKPLLTALTLFVMTGCMHLPAEVAEELSAPDGQRPNHYAVISGQDSARPEQPAELP